MESHNRHLKTALDQALILRGCRDFDDAADWRRFVDQLVARRNRRRESAVRVEAAALRPLPARRATDFTEAVVRVTRTGGFLVHSVFYSAPSRTIGQRLRVHIDDDRIEAFPGATSVVTHPRRRCRGDGVRVHSIDYRHVIHALHRKPQARAVDVHALPAMLTALRLPGFHRHWPTMAERADKEGWPAARFLATLAELEIVERETRRIRRHLIEPRLPGGKTLATFDFKALPSVPRALVEAGRCVLYTRTTDLVQRLQAARRDLALEAALARLDRFELIILDDIGYARKTRPRPPSSSSSSPGATRPAASPSPPTSPSAPGIASSPTRPSPSPPSTDWSTTPQSSR